VLLVLTLNLTLAAVFCRLLGPDDADKQSHA